MSEWYEIKARPTAYSGINFRSRLEAQWAHLFDQIGMPWEYEPKVEKGWIPDFCLWGKFLVEVKPISPCGFAMPFEDCELVEKAVRGYHTILLGDGPGSDFGCLVQGDGDFISARTFFYDPKQKYLMRSVNGDGGNDPQRHALALHWRKAVNEFRKPKTKSRCGIDRRATTRRRLNG